MGSIIFAAPGQSLADLAGEIAAEEYDDAYRRNYLTCAALSDDCDNRPPRISRKRREEREWRRLFGAEE